MTAIVIMESVIFNYRISKHVATKLLSFSRREYLFVVI